MSAIDAVLDKWWYYGVELRPGVVTKGIFPPRVPMLPRMLLRGVDLAGARCLDIGSMEGLMPVLMRRQGAREVMATDAIPHCEQKMAAVKEAYGVTFDYRTVGLMYGLYDKLADRGGFDLINFTGVGYHVFSPMHCLAGLRPLLKKNGLMIIGTNVVNADGYSLEFNHRGRFQPEANTFWYHTIPMVEYLARYFQLVPIDCLFYPNSPVNPATYVPGLDLGYLVFVARAAEEDEATEGDAWAKSSRALSWEFQRLCNRAAMDAQPVSPIVYSSRRVADPPVGGIDLLTAARDPRHQVAEVDDLQDSHVLMLAHRQ